MNYIYPKLSEHDLGFVRLGGAGLGNILFAWARAAVYARDHGYQMIWPTWPSVKIGPYLRHEKDKRFYGGLFHNDGTYIGGTEKLKKLITCQRLAESEQDELTESERGETVVEFTGFADCFESLLYDYDFVRQSLASITAMPHRSALDDDFSGSVGVHVRLGDFNRVSAQEASEGRHDSALPIDWYVNTVQQIRKYAGDVPVYVFSDGTDEELMPLLAMDGVKRKSYGSSIADIWALSRFPLLVASGSSFSMWARYLGRADCICYPNQIKEKILTPEEDSFEIESYGEIPEEIGMRIRERLTGIK